jgi:Xaa-Pro aminopeptidase
MRKFSFISILLLALAISASAQQPFNKSEFVARRAKLFEKIPDGIAVIFAAKDQHYPIKFRQAPDFYYLTGVEEAGAVLVLIGPTKAAFLCRRRCTAASSKHATPLSRQ